MKRRPSPARPRVESLEDRITPIAGDLLRTLPNPAPLPADQFGLSVAVAGNRMVVGAPFDDPGGVTDAGRAYLAGFTGGTLLGGGSTASNPSPNAGDRFGAAVGVTIFGELLAGAPGDDPGGVTDAGTVYVYDSNAQAITYTL